jgi:ankyrin repeat protein
MRPIVRLLLYTSLITAVGIIVLAVRREVNTRALREAIDTGDRAGIHWLADQGADMNARGFGGTTALISFTKNHDLQGVRDLIGHGAKVDLIDATGSSALTYAGLYRYTDIARVLIEAGASTKDGRGRQVTTESLATKVTRDLLEEGERGWGRGFSASLKKAMAAGVDVHMKDKEGRTLLLTLFRSQDARAEDVQELLRLGADPNVRDRQGSTPLLLAIQADREDIAQTLVDAGADLLQAGREFGFLPPGFRSNEPNEPQVTPAEITARRNDVEMLRWMVDEMASDSRRYSSAAILAELRRALKAMGPEPTLPPPIDRRALRRQLAEAVQRSPGLPKDWLNTQLRQIQAQEQMRVPQFRLARKRWLETAGFLNSEIAHRSRATSARTALNAP